jgi:sec-independent protein translocase protein TatA
VFNIGPTELLVILVLALIVFGPKRLPEIGRTVGKSLREVRRASMDIRQELEGDLSDDDLWPGNREDASPVGSSPKRPANSGAVDEEGRGAEPDGDEPGTAAPGRSD